MPPLDLLMKMAGPRGRRPLSELTGLVGIASQYDANDVDVHFLGSEVIGTNVKSSQAIERLFDSTEAHGINSIRERLEILLLDYLLSIEDAQDMDRDEVRSGRKARYLKAIKPVN